MSSTKTAPQTIQGGCLCEGIRYQVNFAPDFDFSKGCSTCQCVQCRKNAGAVIAHLRRIEPENITFTAQKTLKKYYATPGIARGFCSECGSWVYWHPEEDNYLALAIGTVDKEDLLKYGSLLAESNVHFYCAEEILGITDSLPGEKWKYDNEGEGAELM
uniref:CENP-V/GFA domain-containing protein n=1 Tax=Bionectria ochroleuca TaxID=29856 RepID=A0A8H7NJV7_BIOOC